ncbi:hypothetical protein LTR17_001608 [Elasticomyces elasticus]|nr:hypothetical protein LTR17_001608 [Elasticomyces elasticus]
MFHYRPLTDPSKQIRLLKLEPVRGGADEIRISLSSWDLAEAPEYVAISYTWGSDKSTHRICINDGGFCVRKNCSLALQECQRNEVTAHIWIDALCINQTDMEEKSHQVAMMGTIFGQAVKTYVSLGSWDNESSNQRSNISECRARFRTVVEDLGRLETPDWEHGDKPGLAKIEVHQRNSALSYALRELEGARYWRRLWVLQELFLSDRIAFFYPGGKPIEFRCLAKTYQRLFYIGNKGRHWQVQQLWNTDPLKIVILKMYPGSELGKWHGLMQNQWYKAQWDVLLAEFSEWQCEDPRDKIYGLLPFMEWPADVPPLRPDYSKTRMELAVQLTAYCEPMDTWNVGSFLRSRMARWMFRLEHHSGELMRQAELVQKAAMISFSNNDLGIVHLILSIKVLDDVDEQDDKHIEENLIW